MISPLLTDLYQLTMAYGYWKLGLHEREAAFHLVFRKLPFRNNYAITCGLATIIDFINHWHFTENDLSYLSSLRAPNETPLFTLEFLDYLKTLHFTCDVDALPEGTLVFPHEPLVRIKGPLLQCQLMESTFLNVINFQTLIATKASCIYQVAQGDSIVEFGLRRAQGPDGALSASRAAYIGGCDATSNVLAGKLYDIPVIGTHAHSWVTVFADEITAFDAYATVMPHNCVLLVDTYDTIEGVKHAIEVGKKLRKTGGELRGIRLDSGDLAALSLKARALLDEAGFGQTKIIASASLDEHTIKTLKAKGAPIEVWGVGTHLVTGYDHPALDGVYKLSAIRDEKGQWQYKLKLSEQIEKISDPGLYQVRRFLSDKKFVRDVMYDLELGLPDIPEAVTFEAPHSALPTANYTTSIDLLKPIFDKGKLIYKQQSIHTIREWAIQQATEFLHTQGDKSYAVGLEKNIYELKQRLIKEVSSKSSCQKLK